MFHRGCLQHRRSIRPAPGGGTFIDSGLGLGVVSLCRCLGGLVRGANVGRASGVFAVAYLSQPAGRAGKVATLATCPRDKSTAGPLGPEPAWPPRKEPSSRLELWHYGA